LHAPFPTEPTALEIASLDVDVDCSVWKDVGLECQTSATYSVVNPTTEAVTATLEVRSTLTKVSVDGAAVKVRDEKFELSIVAGGTRAMVTTKRVRMWPRRVYQLPFLQRHMIYGTPGRGPLPSMLLPRVSPERWARAGDAVYTARYPTKLAKLDSWEHADADGRRVATRRGSAEETTRFAPTWSPTMWGPFSGGPFMELGGTFDEGFRLALGYEMAFNRWLILSGTAETHFDDVILTPAVEFGVWFPGFGAGFGAPVKVHPDTEVGVRGQVSIIWVLGFVVTVDYWPGDDVWRTTLSGRIGI
jgi:hypothetical protein